MISDTFLVSHMYLLFFFFFFLSIYRYEKYDVSLYKFNE